MVEHPSRRGLLLVAAVAGLAACTAGALTPLVRPPGAEELAVREVVADATLLRSSALALAARFAPGTASRTLYQGLAADHLAHLVALGAGTSSASPSPSASTSPTASLPDSPEQQLDAEWDAARSALQLGLVARAGGLAQLLVRIAAARAAHADLIAAATRAEPPGELRPPSDPASTTGATPNTTAGGSPASSPAGTTAAGVPVSPSETLPGPNTPGATGSAVTPQTSPTPSPGSVLASPTDRALNRLLAGEHAAVYAYPVVIARTTGSRQDFARRLWAEHRNERDILVNRITSAGVEPAEAHPAYGISPLPSSPRQAAQLAAKLERGLAELAVDVVATSLPGPDRTDGAAALVLAARRTATWAGHADPLPGGGIIKVAPSPTAGSTNPTADVDATADPTVAPTNPTADVDATADPTVAPTAGPGTPSR